VRSLCTSLNREPLYKKYYHRFGNYAFTWLQFSMREFEGYFQAIVEFLRSISCIISCPLDYLLNLKNPTPPKLRFVSPPRRAGRGWGWGAMTVGIITNYPDMISGAISNVSYYSTSHKLTPRRGTYDNNTQTFY
jgi:hypothetical protein